jgi:hypothetical protein
MMSEVTVTNIKMPFGSMIVFMVKWAVASIPALLILAVLACVFWSFAIGSVLSLSTLLFHEGSSSARTTATEESKAAKVPEGQSAIEANYVSQILVKNLTASETDLGGMGVFGEIKNTGDHALKEVDLTVYCLGTDGKPVFEHTYYPVLVSDSGIGDNSPLRPGYSRKFGYRLDDAPSDWGKKVDVKVSRVQFR